MKLHGYDALQALVFNTKGFLLFTEKGSWQQE